MTNKFSAWGLAYIRRGNGDSASYFLSILSSSYITRTIFVTYVAVTIAASTWVTIEALLCLTGVKKNGIGGVRTVVRGDNRLLTYFADCHQHQAHPRLFRLHGASRRVASQCL